MAKYKIVEFAANSVSAANVRLNEIAEDYLILSISKHWREDKWYWIVLALEEEIKEDEE